ncbi:MAG: hypothetical protein WEA24_11825 [Gemmatimonadota bacterium]
MPAWEHYLEVLRRDVGDLNRHLEPREALGSAAHKAYQETADRLSRDEAWEDERVLRLTRGFNEDVKQWREAGVWDWDVLEGRLRAREEGGG